jgi:uncharacterized protein YfaS (alpha-2-macroglobulin family)
MRRSVQVARPWFGQHDPPDSNGSGGCIVTIRSVAPRRVGTRLIAVAIGLAACALHGTPASAASVVQFTPQGTVKGVRQVTARFSAPLVALGDPRLPAPFKVECPAAGHGRWADGRNWVYDFEQDLPAGLECRFTLEPSLETLAGEPVERGVFTFDTGGPAVIASLPDEGSTIDAEQVFVLALDAPATSVSVTQHASCVVDNIAERIPVEVLTGGARAQVLSQRRALGYQYANLFRQLTGDGLRDLDQKTAARYEAAMTVLRCRRALPADTRVTLSWDKGIATASGIANRREQTLAFMTRPEFTVRMECDRVNASAPCLPMLPVRLAFSSPVPLEAASGIEVSDGAGRTYRADEFKDETRDAGATTVEGLSFAGPFPERGKLTIELPQGFVDDNGRRPQNTDRFPLGVPLDEYPPLVKFSGEFGILEAATGGVLPVTLRNVERSVKGRRAGGAPSRDIPGSTKRIETDAGIVAWLERVKAAMGSRGEWQPPQKDQDRGTWLELTGSESVFKDDDATTAFTVPRVTSERGFEVVGIPLGKPGFYVVELASPRLGAALLGGGRTRYVATSALVTNMSVHFKWGRESSRVWVTALDTGRPVRGARIAISDYCGGGELWSGTTDADGLARVPDTLGAPHSNEGCDSWSPHPLIVSARVGEDVSFVLSSWQRGIDPSDFRLLAAWYGADDSTTAATVFDRTLLRAGETLSMKHFVRERMSAGLSIPAPAAAPTKLVLTHAGSGQEYSMPVEFDAQGIAESQWQIPAEVKLGVYRATLSDDGNRRVLGTGDVRVEQYRVPTMKAVVQPPAKAVVNQPSVPLDLFVGYLSGGPAAGAPVRLRTLVEPRTPAFRHYEDFSFGGGDVKTGIEEDGRDDLATWLYSVRFGPYGRSDRASAVANAVVQPLTLDAQGAARTTVALPQIDTPQSLTAELEYQDANGERLTAATRVPLWPAALALGLQIEGWAGRRDDLRFKVVAVDTEGKPLAGREIEVTLFERRNLSYRKRLIGGFYAYENKVEVRPLEASCKGRTNRQGLLSCHVEPEVSGEIVLRARAEDGSGNATISSTTAWVAGDGDWWFAPGSADRMDVLPEQKEYQPGDTARFQVRMPFRSATALVTVEREGVIDSFVTRLSGRKPVVEVPIEDGYAPNVYVSVLAVRGRVAGWRAWLADLARRFHLPFLSLDGGAETALVDLSKPAFRLGIAQVRVGWKAQRLDVDVKPAQAMYRVRERALVDVNVERENGEPLPAGAEIALAAVDEGLLELRPNDSWALLDHMMGERPIAVWTSTAQMQVVGKRTFGRKAIPHGGGGGHAGARQMFDTLLLWKGRVKLDAKGHARVEIPLNDSLTSFRIVAVANAGPQAFGTGSASIATSQELMLHAGLPPLVREGDRYTATFTARNATKRAMRVTARASASVDAAGTRATSLPPLELEIAAGGARELSWLATAPVGTGKLYWNVELDEAGGAARDRLKVEQSVIAAYPVRTYQATLLQLSEPVSIEAERPTGAVPGRGGVAVTLQPTLSDGLQTVRDYMDWYPYTCLEQQVSKTVALREDSRWDRVAASMPEYLDPDGLLRYFATDRLEGSDTLTAYVLAITQEAGYEIPGDVREKAIDALKRFVAGRLIRESVLPTADLTLRKLAAIEALTRYDAADASMVSSFTIEPNLWPTSAVIDWLNVLERLQEIPDRDSRRAQAEQVLRSRLNFQGTTLGFSTERSDALWWLMISADTNATRTLLAVTGDPGWREDAPRILRGALGRLERGRWDTTTANAWGVLAVEKFAKEFERVPVSGRTAVAYRAAERSVTWPVEKPPAALEFPWGDGASMLQLRHEGAGRPWVIVQSRAALPLTEPLSTGFAIHRDITPIEQQASGRWTRGDVARVTLTVDAQSDMGWVVVEDPVPTGASLLGSGLGRDSAALTQGERREGYLLAAYEERTFDVFRAYYRYVPKGTFTVAYTLRYNNAGSFQLPATRVEAMYTPEMFGERPNAAVTVGAAQ